MKQLQGLKESYKVLHSLIESNTKLHSVTVYLLHRVTQCNTELYVKQSYTALHNVTQCYTV